MKHSTIKTVVTVRKANHEAWQGNRQVVVVRDAKGRFAGSRVVLNVSAVADSLLSR